MTDEQTPAPGTPAYTPPRPGPMQRFRRIGVLVALVVLVVFLGADLLAGLGGAVGRLVGPDLAPAQELAQVQESRDTDRLADLRRRFPRDPRVRLLAAFAAEDRAAAEEHLRAALEEKRALRSLSPDGKLEATVRSILARLLVDRGEDAGAREALRPSCGAPLEGVATSAGLEDAWVQSACAGT